MQNDGTKYTVKWFGLILILALIILSIHSAFIGAERSQILFNSIPMQVFWFVLLLCLIASLIMFPSMLKKSLLLIHIGCVLILLGSMISSETGHKMISRTFGIHKIHSGRMIIHEGKRSNTVVDEQHQIFELPFTLQLGDFRIEYYDDSKNIKDFISELKVVDNNEIKTAKNIEVNKPLHYGGYWFYQNSYDVKHERFTVLSVASDNGIMVVFGGYILLMFGLVWQLWFKTVKSNK